MIKYCNTDYLKKNLERYKNAETVTSTFCDFATLTHGVWWYSLTISQYSYDEIVMTVKCAGTVSRSYIVPIKKRDGMSWKLNKKSISCDSGKAVDMIYFLINPEHKAYLTATIENLIFSGNIAPDRY